MTIVLIAIVAYLIAAGLLVTALGRERRPGPSWLAAALVATLLHAIVHVLAWHQSGSTDMHFFAALSLVGLGMAMLTTVFGASNRMVALGVVVYPLAALMLAAYGVYGHHFVDALDWRLQLHAWCALLAYATLAIAALLAMMLWLQERALRRREMGSWRRALPPLTELENPILI